MSTSHPSPGQTKPWISPGYNPHKEAVAPRGHRPPSTPSDLGIRQDRTHRIVVPSFYKVHGSVEHQFDSCTWQSEYGHKYQNNK
ncbi:hypothetical protein CYMTET_37932 [Cymbomonas tetramitiformis]|uniref:Uncharacterized protein n=1 Tax=Cymbomonas tetramitiformis TaxID=36881 RepID=A0AAE0F739_9CHLO|nr:hypothetical protein CYMTET_37932 [Cymbomonas tetramitiformis]